MKKLFNLFLILSFIIFSSCNKKDKRPNILIDDHKGNIREWESAGGIGILHTSAASTINDFKKIGFP